MSYLTLPTGIPDFTKGVISLWFRVPQESINNCLTKSLAIPPFAPAPLYGIIPFVVFGSHTTVSTAVSIAEIGSYMDGAAPFTTYKDVVTTTSGVQTDPSVIGLKLAIDPNAGAITGLSVYGNFQTSAPGNINGLQLVADGSPTFVSDGGDDFVSGQEVSWYSPPQNQGLQTYGFEIDVPVDGFADRWHHVVTSFDLSNSVSGTSNSTTLIGGITGANYVWVALDDVNYNQDSLTIWVGGQGDNAVCSQAILSAVGQPTPPTTLPLLQSIPVIAALANIVNGVPGGQPTTDIPATCTVPGSPILANNFPLGLPATSEFTDNIYRVELAEFLMWTGVTLDTSVEANRRLFITKPDNKGKQTPINETPIYIPISKTAVGDPTTWEDGADIPAFVPPVSSMDPSAVATANKVLGVAAVDFTKASLNWMMGRNLGTVKGKVKRTGKVKPFFPDPSVGG